MNIERHTDRVLKGVVVAALVVGVIGFAAVGAFGVGGELAEEFGYTQWWAGPAITALVGVIVVPLFYLAGYVGEWVDSQ